MVRQFFLYLIIAWLRSRRERDPVEMSLLPSRFRGSVMDALNKSFFAIVSALRTHHPVALHSAIDVGTFTLLLVGRTPKLTSVGPIDPLSTFCALAEAHTLHDNLLVFHGSFGSPLLTFTETLPPEEVQIVVAHLLRRCAFLATSEKRGTSQVRCARYFLSLAASVRNNHVKSFRPFFSREIHVVLDTYSDLYQWIRSALNVGDEIFTIALQLKAVLPTHCHAGSPLKFSRSPGVLELIFHQFLQECTMGGEGGHLRSQVLLANLTLVSRIWHPIVLDLLYSRPVLFSIKAFHCFLRTIHSLPRLARRVRILDLGNVVTASRIRLKRVTSSPRIIDADLAECHNLNDLAVNWNAIPGLPRITYQLRMLRLSGCIPKTVFPNLVLPFLETLRLDGCEFPCRLPFRLLPRLRALRIYNLSQNSDTSRIDVSYFGTIFPNLRIFELLHQGMKTLSSSDSAGGSESAKTIHNYSVMHSAAPNATKSVPTFPLGNFFTKRFVANDSQAFSHIDMVVLGVIDDFYDMKPFASWVMNSTLRSLVLHIASTPQNQNPLQSILHFLDTLDPCSLKSLKIKYKEYGGPRYHLDDETFMETIIFICDSLGIDISFDVDTEDRRSICARSSTYSQYIADM